jgi:hypothetical protein
MTFTVTGRTADGDSFTVHWNDGEIGGDAVAVALVLEQIGRSVAVTPTGPFVTGALGEPVIALETIGAIFPRGWNASGDVPELPELPPLPPGAIA